MSGTQGVNDRIIHAWQALSTQAEWAEDLERGGHQRVVVQGQVLMMILPANSDYINAHEHYIHLWETPVKWGLR